MEYDFIFQQLLSRLARIGDKTVVIYILNERNLLFGTKTFKSLIEIKNYFLVIAEFFLKNRLMNTYPQRR